ncbi:MAG TPA: hypothetical protein DCS93_29150 [Microscillaceae bacterium]|nr:hypothetical protein [Microscillaceae bacterium]
MKKLIFIFTVFAAFTFASCGGSNTKEGDGTSTTNTNEETKKNTDDEKKKEADIALTNYENKTIGFTILVPKAGKVLADGEFGYTNSQVLSGGMFEVNVSVNPAVGEVNSVDDYKKDLGNMMAKNITKAEKTEGGFMAINEQGPLLTVYHRTGKVQAKVSVPKKMKALAEKIAMSLKSAK